MVLVTRPGRLRWTSVKRVHTQPCSSAATRSVPVYTSKAAAKAGKAVSRVSGGGLSGLLQQRQQCALVPVVVIANVAVSAMTILQLPTPSVACLYCTTQSALRQHTCILVSAPASAPLTALHQHTQHCPYCQAQVVGAFATITHIHSTHCPQPLHTYTNAGGHYSPWSVCPWFLNYGQHGLQEDPATHQAALGDNLR